MQQFHRQKLYWPRLPWVETFLEPKVTALAAAQAPLSSTTQLYRQRNICAIDPLIFNCFVTAESIESCCWASLSCSPAGGNVWQEELSPGSAILKLAPQMRIRMPPFSASDWDARLFLVPVINPNTCTNKYWSHYGSRCVFAVGCLGSLCEGIYRFIILFPPFSCLSSFLPLFVLHAEATALEGRLQTTSKPVCIFWFCRCPRGLLHALHLSSWFWWALPPNHPSFTTTNPNASHIFQSCYPTLSYSRSLLLWSCTYMFGAVRILFFLCETWVQLLVFRIFFSNWATSALSIAIYKREHREAVADHSLKSSSLDHRLHYISCNFILLMFDSIRNISSEACCSSWSVWSSLSLLQCLKKCRKILNFLAPPPFLFFLLFVCVCVYISDCDQSVALWSLLVARDGSEYALQ